MKRAFCFLGIASFLAICQVAGAQHYDPAHRHSIEISTGIPPLHGQLGYDANLLKYQRGIEMKRLYMPSVNVGYTFCISEKWDFNAVFNACAAVYSMSQYKATFKEGDVKPDGTIAQANEFDFQSAPESTWTETSPSYSLMADARFKWYRSESVRLYSALGAGVSLVAGNVIPTPYITPVGINFGKNHIYGLAELNISSAATIALAGIGFRF